MHPFCFLPIIHTFQRKKWITNLSLLRHLFDILISVHSRSITRHYLVITMSNRRNFLKFSALGLIMGHPLARAHMHHDSPTNKMGLGNGGEHTMMPNHAQSILLALDQMPSKQPLTALPQLKNTSKKPHRFQATLVAKPTQLTIAGRQPTEFWLYNGQLPGPQITVNEGDTVEILFKNQLPEASTIHWHGLPVPADQDGNPQDSVPSGEERRYLFTLPKGSAGTYWYHPHPHGRTSTQVAKGLAGTLVVRAADDPLAHLPEQHWMITDLRLDHQAQVPENTMLDWMNGREGQFVLVNGQREPRISLTTHTRLRIWNNCSARYLQLAIPGCQWQLIGTDGGLLETAQPPVDEILLAPAERIEVLLIANSNHSSTLISRYYDREKMMVKEEPVNLTLAHLTIESKEPLRLPHVLRPFANLDTPVAHKTVEFSEAPMNHHGHAMSMEQMHNMFFINGKTFDMTRIDLRSQVGEVEEWRVFNNSHMDHPFHLHGTQFQVVQRELKGKISPEPFKAWRDTINLKPYETVIFHVKQSLPGVRMLHCHILEHEDLGMMANLEVTA